MVLLWVASRAKFVFLDDVLQRRAQIVEPWKRFRREGNSLFVCTIVLFLIAFGMIAITVLSVVASIGINAIREATPSTVALLVTMGVLAAIVGVGFAYVAFYLQAFVVPLILFSLGGMFAIYEGVSKIRHPHEIESASIAIGILLVAIALESASLRTAIVEARKAREAGMSWWGFIHRSKQPELRVVLLEDLGALIGLFFPVVADPRLRGLRRPTCAPAASSARRWPPRPPWPTRSSRCNASARCR